MMSGEHAAVISVLLYLFLRWMLRPLAVRLPAAVDFAVDIAGALLLVPEYICTSVLRKLFKRAGPVAFLYGEAISGLAVLARGFGLTLADTLDRASAGIGHREAAIGGLIGTTCLALLS